MLMKTQAFWNVRLGDWCTIPRGRAQSTNDTYPPRISKDAMRKKERKKETVLVFPSLKQISPYKKFQQCNM
jgi:hypothetical protein